MFSIIYWACFEVRTVVLCYQPAEKVVGENTVLECEDLGSLMMYMSVIELDQGVGVSQSSFHRLEYLNRFI
jgi:hypothetical protein